MKKNTHQFCANPLRCNACGKELDIFDLQEDFTIDRHLGYGTSHDGEHLHIQFCCECMNKLIDGSPVNPCSKEIHI